MINKLAIWTFQKPKTNAVSFAFITNSNMKQAKVSKKNIKFIKNFLAKLKIWQETSVNCAPAK